MSDEVLLSQFLENLKAYKKPSGATSFIKGKLSEDKFSTGLELIINKLEKVIKEKSYTANSLSIFLRDTLEFLDAYAKEENHPARKFSNDGVQFLEGIIPKLDCVTMNDLQNWKSVQSIKPIVTRLIETRKILDQESEEKNKKIYEAIYKPRIEKVKMFLQAIQMQIGNEIAAIDAKVDAQIKYLVRLRNEKNKYQNALATLESDHDADSEEIEDLKSMISGVDSQEVDEDARLKIMHEANAHLNILLEKFKENFKNQLFQEDTDENNDTFYTNQINYIQTFLSKNADSLIAKMYNSVDESHKDYGKPNQLMIWLNQSDFKQYTKALLPVWYQCSDIKDHYTQGAVIGLLFSKAPEDVLRLIANKLNRQEGAKVSQANKKSRDKAHEEENKLKPKSK